MGKNIFQTHFFLSKVLRCHYIFLWHYFHHPHFTNFCVLGKENNFFFQHLKLKDKKDKKIDLHNNTAKSIPWH